jgi:porin
MLSAVTKAQNVPDGSGKACKPRHEHNPARKCSHSLPNLDSVAKTLEWLDRCWVPSHTMRKGIPHHFLRAAVAFILCSVQSHVRAEEAAVAPEEAGVAPISGMQIEPRNVPSKAPAGLLPIPDYSATIWTRQYVTGDWWGARTFLANKGIQIGVELNQYVQGVTNGGRERVAEYGGTADYTVNLDLMRMGVLPGALIKFRAESRFGSSVNGAAGPILPVNTDLLFPLTDTLDEDVPITVTDLNYTQFLSPYLGVFFGKLDTLDGDPNEFASGRGTSQFMNANFIFNPALALRLPYSTLAAGVILMPIPPGPKGGITLVSTVMNTQDSSTTSGFDDFDEGTTWTSEVDFQYRLGPLPGGLNVGGIYSFNQNFAALNSRFVFQPGEGLVVPNRLLKNWSFGGY